MLGYIWSFIKGFSTFEKITGFLILVTIIMKLLGYEFKFFEKERSKKHNPENKSENYCRKIFESIFEKPFHTVRPDWLKNPETDRNLELDGYCETIKSSIGVGVAFEYDGIQHSQYSPHFHSSREMFLSQVYRDRVKEKICKERGVVLIRIPHHVPKDKMERYIKDELKKYGPYEHL